MIGLVELNIVLIKPFYIDLSEIDLFFSGKDVSLLCIITAFNIIEGVD